MLRDYQQKVYDGLKESLLKNKSVIVQMPCRSGKSYLMLQVCLDALKKGSSVLILAHRNLLLEQHKELINIENVRINNIYTEYRRLREYEEPKIILIDEAHLSASDTYLKVFDYYKNSILIGFTATPCRLDGKPLGNIYQDIVKGPTVKYLIDKGNISPYEHYAPHLDIDMSNVKLGDGDYNLSELEIAMLNPKIYGDIINNYKKLADNKQAIAYCVSVKHANIICDLFNQNGYSAKCISSNTPEKERNIIMNEFKNNEFKILCNCNLISEGITVPNCEVVLMLRPTQSYALYIQQGCRALTPKPNKKAIIIDYVGNVFRHGSIDNDEEWDLTQKKKCRNPSGERDVIARTCTECFLTFSGNASICPYCGANLGKTKRELKIEEETRLERIEAFERRQKRMEVGMSRSFQELCDIALDRGYKPGWVLSQSKIKHIPIDWSAYNKLKRKMQQ